MMGYRYFFLPAASNAPVTTQCAVAVNRCENACCLFTNHNSECKNKINDHFINVLRLVADTI